MDFEATTELVPFSQDQERSMRAAAIDAAPGLLAAVDAAQDEQELFYALPNAAMAAWHLGQLDTAQRYAERELELASRFTGDWNYGNAISLGHNVLGLLALHHGRTEEAVNELRKAGETPGSPQLASFGPSMQLARALARQGEFKAGLEYIAQSRVFWKTGEAFLNLWEQKLRAHEVPNFFNNGYR